MLPRNSLIGVVVSEEAKEEEEQGILATLSSMTNMKLLGDPKFLLICASNTFGFLGFYVPFVYLPSLADSQLDITSEQVASQMISEICIMSTFIQFPTYIATVVAADVQLSEKKNHSLRETKIIWHQFAIFELTKLCRPF